MTKTFQNPFRPGAGHMPPYLAGRDHELTEFKKLLEQTIITENCVLTGLRGVGKTVLLETFKPIAIQHNWNWVGTDLSEAASITEANMATRIITDLSVLSSSVIIGKTSKVGFGFGSKEVTDTQRLTFDVLEQIYLQTPGLVADKLKAVLETAWKVMQTTPHLRGIIFSYDEAQNLADHAEKEQFPLSMMLDVFQSIQRKGIPFMLVLTGLPTLFPKLVEARTYAERMFHVIFLQQLSKEDSKEAVVRPTNAPGSPFQFSKSTVDKIVKLSGGYPYFIQFMCREVFDVWIQKASDGKEPTVNFDSIVQKLDNDFFAGRWAKATDRQRELLTAVAGLPDADDEFTVQDVVGASKKELEKPFSNSHVNQMFASLIKAGLLYKNRHGRYSFAVPLLSQFIKRQLAE